MSDICKRIGCNHAALEKQAYCSRECSPYGGFMSHVREPSSRVTLDVFNKVQKFKPDLKALIREPKKHRAKSRKLNLSPGNGKMALKFTNLFITLLLDEKYLNCWKEETLQKVSNRMKLIFLKLEEEIQIRYKDKTD